MDFEVDCSTVGKKFPNLKGNVESRVRSRIDSHRCQHFLQFHSDSLTSKRVRINPRLDFDLSQAYLVRNVHFNVLLERVTPFERIKYAFAEICERIVLERGFP
jgi:hypothetical protein